jgi:hypothetical protein
MQALAMGEPLGQGVRGGVHTRLYCRPPSVSLMMEGMSTTTILYGIPNCDTVKKGPRLAE